MRPAWLLWRPTKANRSVLYAFKFRHPDMEREYQACLSSLRVVVAAAYLGLSIFISGVHAASFWGSTDLPVTFWCFLLELVVAVVALIALITCEGVRRQVVSLHASIVLASLMLLCFMSVILAEEWLMAASMRLKKDFPIDLVDALARILNVTFGNQSRASTLFGSQFHLISLSFMGYNAATIPIAALFFLAFLITMALVPYRSPPYIGLFALELLLTIVPFLILCVSIEVLQRLNFHSQQELKRELETSQMAETMLNTTVKNALADAVANLQACLGQNCRAVETLLPETLGGLARGMRACQQRQAFLALVSDTYAPQFAQVGLRDFGAELVAGRAVVGDFADSQVLLDPLLCSLVLDNALAQAFRYCHPEGPDIRVTIHVERLPGTADILGPSRIQVVFEVSFVGQEEGLQQETLEYFELRSPPGPLPAHYLTQRHLRLAADAHGMTVRWHREEERIVFRAACVSRLAEPTPRAELPPKHVLDAFPCGLTFFIIDDSVAARRLLSSFLSQQAAPAAVHCFGTYPEDVHQFVASAIRDGDIVICDQHLDYGDQHYLGSDLIRKLRDRGFHGLLCMRSSDMSDRDRELYQASGAHCTFGKEVLTREMVDHIKAAYVQLKGLTVSDDAVSVWGLPSDSPIAHSQTSSSLQLLNWDGTEQISVHTL